MAAFKVANVSKLICCDMLQSVSSLVYAIAGYGLLSHLFSEGLILFALLQNIRGQVKGIIKTHNVTDLIFENRSVFLQAFRFASSLV